MIKNRFDHRTWQEIVGDLVIERTSIGESITLRVKYNGTSTPTILLGFQTLDNDKKGFPETEDISTFLPGTPYYEQIDDSTGEPLAGDFTKGFSTWKEFVTGIHGFRSVVRQIIVTGGRNFYFEEE